MKKKYYSYRNNKAEINFPDVVQKFQTVYKIMCEKEYLKELSGIQNSSIPESIKNEALLNLPFQPFPIEGWGVYIVTIDQLFDTIEFLFDYISKPYGWELKETETNYTYYDHEGYLKSEGQDTYRDYINMFLNDFEDGFELNNTGEIITIGKMGVDILFNANIIEYDLENIDKRIQRATEQWRKRSLSLEERKSIIKDLADVFEWLKKSKELDKVLDKKDDRLIFDMVNNFEIRHHNPEQKGNYDKSIWYSWMFHFYLATYHAVIRMIIRNKE